MRSIENTTPEPTLSEWVNFKELRESLDFDEVLRGYGVQTVVEGDQAVASASCLAIATGASVSRSGQAGSADFITRNFPPYSDDRRFQGIQAPLELTNVATCFVWGFDFGLYKEVWHEGLDFR